jgi:choice-of-anchor C domain-containing protein
MLNAKILVSAAVMAIAGFAASAANAAIIVDGNFDTPVASNPFQTFSSGATFGTGNPWTVTSGSIDEIGNYWQAPPTGGNSVDLDGNAPGGISQSFTAPAGTYDLSFYLSGNPDGSPSIKQMTVSVGSATQLFTYTVTGDKTNMNFVLEHLTFTSAGGTNTLLFTSNDIDSPYGAVIGGINIAAVPEPATWLMLILGFGGIGWMLRSSRQRNTVTA